MEKYVMELGAGNPVVVFSKTTCCMSYAIVMLIRGFGANPVVYELDNVPYGRQMEKALMGLGCNPSVPAVFIGQEFIGGSNEIMSLNVKGKLKPLLMKANAIWM
ncbi:Monothiol glutaredoxin-S6 [Striga hermonthica]|uniref:Monothiol glutaredoxin-S6 n=1 Tax=Striga hermonthica TaxID=68872 RepID=A0A9N7NCS3_STRHE|nr:Monothiol glutaredoxin-S6 [Striga hermonthica]